MRDGLGGIDSVALIGGTSDIGLAICRELRTLGANRYVLAGRDTEAMRTAAKDLPVAEFVDLDLAELASARSVADDVFIGGDLDVVVIAAGVLHTEPDPGQITEMAVANGAGSIAILAEVADRFRRQGHGHLVVISSLAVVRPRPSNYWYGASKAGLDFAAVGLAASLEGTGVTMSIVRPGFVRTKMTEGMPAAPFATTPDAVARAVASAAGGNANGVLWVPGVLRWVSLIIRWLPRSILHRLDR